MGTTAPAGWLLCNGAKVSRSTYASLYTVIGNASGSADANSFNVPDLRGRFLRGWDNAIGRDLDRASRTAMATGGNAGDAIGSVQTDAFKSHTHTEYRTDPGGTFVDKGGYGWPNYTYPTESGATGGSETRPINAYVNYIIKF
jgi:microcystin-dependent protein